MPTLLEVASFEVASQPDAQEKITRLMIGGGGIIAAVLILLAVVSAVRKKYFSEEDEIEAPGGFGVSELRELHAQGLLTDEEFNAAKAKIVATSHAAFMAPRKKNPKNAK